MSGQEMIGTIATARRPFDKAALSQKDRYFGEDTYAGVSLTRRTPTFDSWTLYDLMGLHACWRDDGGL